MRWLALIFALLPLSLTAQTSEVLPGELSLSVTVEETAHPPFTREMVLITIKGIYRRHITLETLVQPDLSGFSWAQLGPDSWRDERLDGQKVKIFERQMALYPDRAGTLTIGAFRHDLTLTDEGDDWFEHQIASAPVTIEVLPAPEQGGWWFPVRNLKISDQWSNAPDQLAPGEGVLRVVRLEALGATPEMIPPMPALFSPSGMIFPHPEKRLVELTPAGPVTYAFWRWTIRPSNDISTIVEPITFRYFDTTERVGREVTISAQRVAYGTLTGSEPTVAEPLPPPSRLPGIGVALIAGLVLLVGAGLGLRGRRLSDWRTLLADGPLDPDAWRLRRAARRGDLPGVRRIMARLSRRAPMLQRQKLLRDLDRAAFDPLAPQPDLRQYVRNFLRRRPLSADAG